MPNLNHYHCNECDDAWSSPEDADECPVCSSTNIHEVEFDEMGVAKWRLEKYEDDRVAAITK